METSLGKDDEYDLRQYHQMLASLKKYEAGESTLSALISDLEALVQALRVCDVRWKDAFRKEWSRIEDSYAFALDQEHPEIDTVGERIIEDAVKRLGELVKSKLGAG